MIGSNRQTLELDSDNNHKNNNGSCFEGMTQLADTLSELVLIPVKADLRVYGDALMGKPGGHHAQVSFRQHKMGEVTAEAKEKIKTYKAHIGDHKYCLSFLQIMTTCLSDPDSEVIYLFFDDLKKILTESEQQFGVANVAKSLPRNLLSATFSGYKDSTILSDIAVLAEKIRILANADAYATEDDIDLVLRIAKVCANLANEINVYLSTSELQLALSEIEKKSSEIGVSIRGLKNKIDLVNKYIVIELSKDRELLTLVKELSVFANKCKYILGKENSLVIEKLLAALPSLKDENADHTDLFAIFADPMLLNNICLGEPDDRFTKLLLQFRKQYLAMKKTADDKVLTDEKARQTGLEAEKSTYDNIIRFFKIKPETQIQAIRQVVASLESSKSQHTAVPLATLGNWVSSITPISSLLNSLSPEPIIKRGSEQHNSAVRLGYGTYLEGYRDILVRHNKELYIKMKDMLTDGNEIIVNADAEHPGVTVDQETENSLVLACTDKAIWQDPNNLPSLAILYDYATSAAIYAKFSSVAKKAVDKDNFLATLTEILNEPKCDRAAILAYFTEFKKRQRSFEFLYGQKHPKFDEIRFKFKSSKNSGQGEEKFWHSDTFMKAIKMLKNAYVARSNDTSVKPEAGDTLLDYYRGNKPGKPEKTKTRRNVL